MKTKLTLSVTVLAAILVLGGCQSNANLDANNGEHKILADGILGSIYWHQRRPSRRVSSLTDEERQITPEKLLEVKELYLRAGPDYDVEEFPNGVTDIRPLSKLENLRTLVIFGGSIKDIKPLLGLNRLTSLEVSGVPISNLGIEGIAKLGKLERCNLYGTKITDAGLKEIAKIKQLQVLGLNSNKITDAGLKELVNLKHLQQLWIKDTEVTKAGVAKLEEALPNCRIFDNAKK